MKRRPLAATALSLILIATGAISFFYRLGDFKAPGRIQYENVWIELLRLSAIVCGVFMLRGNNWARWFAIAWLSYHVVLSVFHSPGELAMHAAILALFAYFLFFDRRTSDFFRRTTSQPAPTSL